MQLLKNVSCKTKFQSSLSYLLEIMTFWTMVLVLASCYPADRHYSTNKEAVFFIGFFLEIFFTYLYMFD